MRLLSLLGPLLALAPDAPGGAGGAGDPPAPPAPPEGTVTMTRAELDALVNGAVEKATGPLRSQVETWQKAALDGAWDAAFQQHQVPESLRGLVRREWESIQPKEGEHRPDPAAWLPEQPFFAQVKPPAPAAEPAKTSGRTPAAKSAEPAPAPAANPAPAKPAAPAPAALPPYLTRGPAAPAPQANAPAASTREALKVAVAEARTAEGLAP